MQFNWVTVVMILIMAWPLYVGARRGFARQSGYVMAQLISIIAGVVAIIAGWWGTTRAAQLAHQAGHQALPGWLTQLVRAWQSSPGVARLIVFVVVYFVVAAILRAILGRLPGLTTRLIPPVLGRNRLLGGALGLVVGAARVVVLCSLLFVGLQYLSLPQLAKTANASHPYAYLKNRIFEPWLQPLLNRDLPVLETGALEPLTKNINLLAVPTGTGGQERGVLVVPKQVSSLAKRIVKGDQTDEQKAHDLYEWVSHHIHYDWKKYDDYVYHHHWDGQTPLQTLQTRQGVCADYALLYADMAHSVGLTVDIVEGIGGTQSDNGPHAWNRVYDAQTNSWLNVDTTWGSEQDAWFNPPHFSDTHVTQRTIEIEATH